MKMRVVIYLMFKSVFKIDEIFPRHYFGMSYIFRMNDLRVFARVIDLKDGNYLLYGFTRSLFEIMNRGTIQDFIDFKDKPQDFFWKEEISLLKRRDDKFIVSGNISILSTGEVIGILNKME